MSRLVYDQDPDDPRHPLVRTSYAIESGKLVRGENIALGRCYGKDEIVMSVEPEDFDMHDFARIKEAVFAAAATD